MIENSMYWFVTLPSRAKAGLLGVVFVILITACLAAIALTQGGPSPLPVVVSTSTAIITSSTATASPIPSFTPVPVATRTNTTTAPTNTVAAAPSNTATVAASATTQATDTVVPPSATSEPPTNTPEPPTNTPEPPTSTPEPPTNTPEPPTNTPEPPTSTAVPPTNTPQPQPTAPPTPATVEGQISALITAAVNQSAATGSCRLEREVLPSSRYYVNLLCTLNAGATVNSARNMAFRVHQSLWTADLPLGALRVRVYFQGQPVDAPVVDSQAGFTFMQNQDLSNAGVDSWAELLQANENRDSNVENAVWYDQNG